MNVDEQKTEMEKNEWSDSDSGESARGGGITQNVKEWREVVTEKKIVIVPHKYNNTEYLTRKQ